MPVIFSATPLTFNRDDALQFTGLSEKVFRMLERSGSISRRMIGRHGQAIYRRAELEQVVAQLFGQAAGDIDWQFGLDD